MRLRIPELLFALLVLHLFPAATPAPPNVIDGLDEVHIQPYELGITSIPPMHNPDGSLNENWQKTYNEYMRMRNIMAAENEARMAVRREPIIRDCYTPGSNPNPILENPDAPVWNPIKHHTRLPTGEEGRIPEGTWRGKTCQCPPEPCNAASGPAGGGDGGGIGKYGGWIIAGLLFGTDWANNYTEAADSGVEETLGESFGQTVIDTTNGLANEMESICLGPAIKPLKDKLMGPVNIAPNDFRKLWEKNKKIHHGPQMSPRWTPADPKNLTHSMDDPYGLDSQMRVW